MIARTGVAAGIPPSIRYVPCAGAVNLDMAAQDGFNRRISSGTCCTATARCRSGSGARQALDQALSATQSRRAAERVRFRAPGATCTARAPSRLRAENASGDRCRMHGDRRAFLASATAATLLVGCGGAMARAGAGADNPVDEVTPARRDQRPAHPAPSPLEVRRRGARRRQRRIAGADGRGHRRAGPLGDRRRPHAVLAAIGAAILLRYKPGGVARARWGDRRRGARLRSLIVVRRRCDAMCDPVRRFSR